MEKLKSVPGFFFNLEFDSGGAISVLSSSVSESEWVYVMESKGKKPVYGFRFPVVPDDETFLVYGPKALFDESADPDAISYDVSLPYERDKKDARLMWFPWMSLRSSWSAAFDKESWDSRIRRVAL